MSAKPQEELVRRIMAGKITDATAKKMLAVKPDQSKSEDRTLPLIFNLKNASAYVGVSEQLFRKQVEAGVFPWVALGESRWWRRVDLDKALESRVVRKVGGKTEAATTQPVVCRNPVVSPAPDAAA